MVILFDAGTGLPVGIREANWITTMKMGAFVAHMGSFQEVAPNWLVEVEKLVVDRWAYVSYRVLEIVELVQAGRLSARRCSR